MKKLLLGMLLSAIIAVVMIAPVSASQTESDAIDAVAFEWYQTEDIEGQIDLELALAGLEVQATSPECSVYAGWHLAAIAIFNEWRFTQSPFLESAYKDMVQNTPQLQYACIIAA